MRFIKLLSIVLLGVIVAGCSSTTKKEPVDLETVKEEAIDEIPEEVETIAESEAAIDPAKTKRLDQNWPTAIQNEIESAKESGEPIDDEKIFLLSEEELDAGRKTSGEKIRSAGLQPTMYFSYDSAVVTDSSKEVLKVHAEYLKNNLQLKLLIEGHTDERGSREYNLSLGLRRAENVKEYLLYLGADRSRIEVQTYGEERPVLAGHEEIYWQYNRRAELYYR